MIEDIIEMTHLLRCRMKGMLPFFDDEIDDIIVNHEESPKIIEPLLDSLLDYAYMGIGESQFKRLNSYYKTFNEEYSNDYARFYYETRED
jgi:hypothetical protein